MEPPNCRLFLCARRTGGLACLEAALEAGDVASLLVVGEDAEMTLRELMPLAQAKGVAVLVEGDAPLARRLGADGVEVEGRRAFKAARDALGPDAIVGVRCRTRHDAMEAAEAGADYIGLPWNEVPSIDESLIAWWAGLFVVPCVALGPAEPGEARRLAEAGADFVMPSERMWGSAEAAREVVAATQAVIAGARP